MENEFNFNEVESAKYHGAKALILEHRDVIPVVAAWRVPERELFVFACPFCGKIHSHGAAIDGHRSPHCTWTRQDNCKGYFLKEVHNCRLAGSIPRHLR